MKCKQCDGVRCDDYLHGRKMENTRTTEGGYKMVETSFVSDPVNCCEVRRSLTDKIIDKVVLLFEA